MYFEQPNRIYEIQLVITASKPSLFIFTLHQDTRNKNAEKKLNILLCSRSLNVLFGTLS
jgi:hypothetical protein